MSEAGELLLDEHVGARGERLESVLMRVGERLELRVDGGARGSIEESWIHAVLARYGRPLADDVAVRGPSLDLPSGARLTRLRHLARYDVIARDFLVIEPSSGDALCELATSVTAALVHLLEARLRA